jgi:hypothetical protein
MLHPRMPNISDIKIMKVNAYICMVNGHRFLSFNNRRIGIIGQGGYSKDSSIFSATANRDTSDRNKQAATSK